MLLQPPLVCFRVLVAAEGWTTEGGMQIIKMEEEAQQLEGDAEEVHSHKFFLWAKCN